MRDELKARIAQINAGTAPAGYKKTKVGIVPEEWEVSEIGKQLVEYRELSNDIEQYPVYSSSRKGLMPQSDYYDKKDAVQTNLGYKMVPVGYATYRHMSDDDIFHFNINSTESTILVSCEYPVFTTKQTANQYFVITSLNETARFRYFCRTQKLGGTRTRLYFSNLAKYKLALPPLPEQQKIAEILTAQDAVIALMQKQIELLKQQKKGFLQKLFPAKGCRVPEIRFREFTGDWERRSLGELFEIIDTKHATAPVSEVQTKYRMIRTNCIRNGQLVVDNTDSVIEEVYEKWSERIHLRAGDLVFTREAPLGESAVIPEDEHHYFPGQRIVSMRSRGNVNTLFINQLFYADEFRKEIKIREAASTTVANFGIPSIKSQDVLIPCLNEQLSIGEFFSHIDNLITLHQRKLEQEQQKKKALMQLLLSGKVRVES